MGEEATPAPQSSDPSDPWIGFSFAGYEVLEKIGHGGMGVIYLARHQSLGRLAAIKFLAAHLVTDEAFVQLFLREAKAAANLSHPNIVGVYDAGKIEGDIYYFIMEYVRGQNLNSIQKREGTLSVRDAVEYTRQAASALAYSHHKKIIHRDVKPENLMLTEEGIIKVGDLGLAKWTGDQEGAMTQAGMVVGSPFYISPERLRDAGCNDPRSDIYSLGATLFHLVTGRAPFEGASPVIMAAHLHDPVPSPQEVNPNLDADLSDLIMKMMAKKLEDRFLTMDQVEEALISYQLEHFGASPAIRSRTQPMPGASKAATHPLPKPAGSNFRTVGILAVILLAGAGLYFLLRDKSPPQQPSKPQTAAQPAVSPVKSPDAPAKQPLAFADFDKLEEGKITDDQLHPWDIDGANVSAAVVSAAGSRMLHVTYDVSNPGARGGCSLDLPNVDMTGYNKLSFRVKGGTWGNKAAKFAFIVGLQSTKQSQEAKSLYLVRDVGTEWKMIEIPIADFGLPALTLQAISVDFTQSADHVNKGWLWIDDLVLKP